MMRVLVRRKRQANGSLTTRRVPWASRNLRASLCFLENLMVSGLDKGNRVRYDERVEAVSLSGKPDDLKAKSSERESNDSR